MNIPTVELRNGLQMPVIGLGTSLRGKQLSSHDIFVESVKYALSIGYRHIDTAKAYNNEHLIARAISESGIERKDLFITTKLYPDDMGYDKTLKAFEKSCSKLQTDYIDLYLVHFPGQPTNSRKVQTNVDKARELRLESWRALEFLYSQRRCRAIGVSNFLDRHLNEIREAGMGSPMVNQCEFHPYYNNKQLYETCSTLGIQFQGYSPLGKGNILSEPSVLKIAETYSKTPAQIAIKWSLQNNVVTIPGSVTNHRINENINVFDFELSDEDMCTLWSLNRDEKVSWDPTSVL